MDFLTILDVLNYTLVLIYGLFLSAHISGGMRTRQQKRLVAAVSLLLLLIQGTFWLIWGAETARLFYPLIIHIPLILILIFVLKKRPGVALVSVCTAYLLCQLPRWVKLTVTRRYRLCSGW